MSREWKPGDVALVNSWRGDGQIAFLTERVTGMPRWCVLDGTDTRGLDDDEITAVRPLAVIDPEDRQQVADLVELLIENGWRCTTAHGLRDALREFADPKPPKPDEPTGLGAVVVDEEGQTWVLYTHPDNHAPWCDGSASVDYAEIDAVKVLSEGVTHG